MSPQAATAMQPLQAPVAVKQSPTGDVFNRIQQTYDSIARRATLRSSTVTAGRSVTTWTIGSVPSPNCFTPYTWKSQS